MPISAVGVEAVVLREPLIRRRDVVVRVRRVARDVSVIVYRTPKATAAWRKSGLVRPETSGVTSVFFEYF